MSALPKGVLSKVRNHIWSLADARNWDSITDAERSALYEAWCKSSEIGGVLSHYMDARRVRVYIKDSILKPYMRDKTRAKEQAFLAAINVGDAEEAKARFRKPEGLHLADGGITSWGNSRDWKDILIATFERAYRLDARPHAIALLETGQTTDDETRRLIIEAARRLGIETVAWLG